MKKTTVFILIFSLIFALSACGKTQDNGKTVPAQSEIIESTDEIKPETSNTEQALASADEEKNTEKSTSDATAEVTDKATSQTQTISVPYTTQSGDYIVSVKKNNEQKKITLSSENGEYIGKVVTGSPRAQMIFDGEKEYIITVNGQDYYYDMSSGLLGNSSVKTLTGDVKNQFDDIIKKMLP